MHLFIFESYLVITANLTPAIAFHSFGVVLQCLCSKALRCSPQGVPGKENIFLSSCTPTEEWETQVNTESLELVRDLPSTTSQPSSLCCCCTLSANLCIPGIQSSTSIKDQCFLTYGQSCVPVWCHHLPEDTSRHHPWSNQNLSHPA